MSGNSIDIKVQIPEHYRMKGDNILQRQLTFDTISEWIKMQDLDEYTTNGLIELAATYPTQALPKFRRNFNLMIARVRGKRKLEQRGMEENVENRNEEKVPKSEKKGYQSISIEEILSEEEATSEEENASEEENTSEESQD